MRTGEEEWGGGLRRWIEEVGEEWRGRVRQGEEGGAEEMNSSSEQ